MSPAVNLTRTTNGPPICRESPDCERFEHEDLDLMGRWSRIGLLLLILAAFGWRVQGLDAQSLWRDEVDAIFFATRPLAETASMFVSAGQNGPLYFLALRPWFGLVGTSEFALRYPSVLGGTVAVVLIWQVTRQLLPLAAHPAGNVEGARPGHSSLAWLAALFMAANPYQLWYAQEGKMYAIITALVLLATWCWLQGVGRGGFRPWFVYWLTLTLGMYTHLLLILVFPLHFVWFWLVWPVSRAHWRGYFGALAGLTLPYLPMVWWQWRMLTSTVQLTGFSFTPPVEMARTLLYNHSRGFMPLYDTIWMTPIFFLGAAGLLLGWGEIARRDSAMPLKLAGWRRFALTVSWVMLPVLGIYLMSLRQPIFTDRYVIWIAPALMMWLATGVIAVQRYVPWIGSGLATLLLLYVIGFWLAAGWQQKTLPTKYDLRGGVTYIAQRRSPDALLILQIPHMEFAYRYYTSDFGPRPFADSEARLAPWMGGLWTNNGWPDDAAWHEVQWQMAAQTAGFDDVWLLSSEVEMWDARHLMNRWLNEQGSLVEQADFHGVQVRRFRLVP